MAAAGREEAGRGADEAMSEPQEMPADVPQEPAGRTQPCPACKGKGSKLGKFLGTPDDPCPECAGSGVIEVVEEPLTPWQQEIGAKITRILIILEGKF